MKWGGRSVTDSLVIPPITPYMRGKFVMQNKIPPHNPITETILGLRSMLQRFASGG